MCSHFTLPLTYTRVQPYTNSVQILIKWLMWQIKGHNVYNYFDIFKTILFTSYILISPKCHWEFMTLFYKGIIKCLCPCYKILPEFHFLIILLMVLWYVWLIMNRFLNNTAAGLLPCNHNVNCIGHFNQQNIILVGGRRNTKGQGHILFCRELLG